MDDPIETQDVFQSIIEKSTQLLQHFEYHPERLHQLIDEWLDLASDGIAGAKVMSNNPEAIQDMQWAWWRDTMSLWKDQWPHCLENSLKTMPLDQCRVDAWEKNPFFNLLNQQYLLAKEHTHSLMEHLDFDGDKGLAKRLQFFTQQYLDAISPNNFVPTNPQLMAETLQSHGTNLLKGLNNFLSDIEQGSSRLMISMTDKHAFTVGKNIAVTPGKVVYRNELMELIQYTPQTKQVKSIPLLMIPAWINKYYILDLSPNNSLVRWLVEQGITVFIISWVNPTAAQSKKTITDYLEQGPIAAIEAIQKQLGVKQVNALGFCLGGTLLSMLLAYHKAQNITSIKSATFLASMIDFSDPGDISVYIDEKQITKLENHMAKKGYLEGHFMASAFNSLRASDLIWSFFIRNYLHGKPPVPFDILFWNMDFTNMPAAMHSEYLRWMYLHNDLVKPNAIRIRNIPLDVSQIDVPTYFVSTKKDHIAPWKTTYLGFQLMKGKKAFLLGGSGHIAGIIIPPGGPKYGYYQYAEYPVNPEEWLEKTTYHSGSWWPEWLTWLKKQSGRMITAPTFETLPLTPIMDAPGSYVLTVATKDGPE